MDQHMITTIGEKLQRLNTNESSTSSIFSRNPSSTSVASSISSNTMSTPAHLKKSLSFTKIIDNDHQHSEAHESHLHNNDNDTASSDETLTSKKNNLGDLLELALSRVESTTQGQPKSLNKLTTTPTNEPVIASKWCIILVGLPAAGKSSICKNLIKQATHHFVDDMEAVDFKIDAFNAGNFRRKLSDFKTQNSNFFDFNNQEAKNQRETFAYIALEHLLNSLVSSQIDVGIFDATNSTIERRNNIVDAIKEKEKKTGVKINTMILHIKCTDPLSWMYNVEGKTRGPDYINSNHDVAIADFVRRAELYQKAFQDITREELSKTKGLVYIELDNCGKKVKIDENGFESKDDLVFEELKEFVQEYYNNYGVGYDEKVQRYWANKKGVSGK